MGGRAMSFSNPELLALTPLVLLILALGLTSQAARHRKLAEAFGGAEAARRLTSRDLYGFPRVRLWCLLAAGAALGLAAAGPRLGLGAALDASQPVDMVIAVDLSYSMSATDVEGGRLARAKEVVHAIADVMENERLALTVFADWPYSVLPMTDDPDLIRFFTESLTTDLVELERDQGTALSAVITHARATLDARSRPEAQKVILIISDGEGHEEEGAVLDSVAASAADGVMVWTAGIGTTGGSELIAVGPDSVTMLGEDGEPVVTRLNEDLLRRVAAAGGGGYRNVTGGGGLRGLLGSLRRESLEDTGGSEPVGAALWLVLFALPLLLWEGKLDADGVVELPRHVEAEE